MVLTRLCDVCRVLVPPSGGADEYDPDQAGLVLREFVELHKLPMGGLYGMRTTIRACMASLRHNLSVCDPDSNDAKVWSGQLVELSKLNGGLESATAATDVLTLIDSMLPGATVTDSDSDSDSGLQADQNTDVTHIRCCVSGCPAKEWEFDAYKNDDAIRALPGVKIPHNYWICVKEDANGSSDEDEWVCPGHAVEWARCTCNFSGARCGCSVYFKPAGTVKFCETCVNQACKFVPGGHVRFTAAAAAADVAISAQLLAAQCAAAAAAVNACDRSAKRKRTDDESDDDELPRDEPAAKRKLVFPGTVVVAAESAVEGEGAK